MQSRTKAKTWVCVDECMASENDYIIQNRPLHFLSCSFDQNALSVLQELVVYLYIRMTSHRSDIKCA